MEIGKKTIAQQTITSQVVENLRRDILSKQILRSGTSIGANIAEARCAYSRKDFAAKIYIALKECAETIYWLELLHSTEYLTDEEYNSLHCDCETLRRMLSATTKHLH